MNSPTLNDTLIQAEQFHADGCLEQAARLYRRILATNPQFSRTAYNLGIILLQSQDYPGAEVAFEHCLKIEPQLLEARLNHAFALQEQGRITEALTRYEAIISTTPDCIEARFNLACLQLLQGNLPEGLNGYELRFSTNDPVTIRHGTIPLWNGDSRPGLRLLIHTEQGYGDTLQMLRYLPTLARQGITLFLEVPRPLLDLCSGVAGIYCIERGMPLPAVDCRLPIMSLPHRLGTTLDTIPASNPYLTASPELICQWRNRLPDSSNLRVGICWAGRFDLAVNRKRSCPPELLQPLLGLPRVSFISLQVAPPDGFQLQHPDLLDFSQELTDFNQTAALIANLDLVISIDTAVAHLAAALGTPTWLMLPAVPDWRWLLERDDSPWYPTMRIFRQPAPGNWQIVLTRITDQLRGLTKKKKTSARSLYRLGNRQLRQGTLDQAAENYRHALAQEPTMAAAWHNLAHVCQLMRQHDQALASYHRALQYCPNDPCSLNNLGVLLREMGRLDESLKILGQLVSLYPDDGDGHWNLALSLLTTRRYSEGWQEYEWRFRRTLPVQVHDPGSPRWRGKALEGKTILLCCEQAYGDSIQFVRFAASLADWGATVLLRCPDHSLAHLLAGAPGISRTMTPDDPLPPHDCWSPLLSLPLHLQTSEDSIPACPYLFAPETTNQLEPSGTGLRIGLVWSGRSTDPQRACPVQLLAPLARFSGQVTFFSLQLNSTRHELDLLQLLGIIDLAPRLSDFQATARIMQQLDLIISIDSAPAHLAGALGRETWLLLHQAPDWRWGLMRSDSDWYPTMRLFRQPTGESWQPVIDQVVDALEQRLSSSAAGIPVAAPGDLLALGDRLREREQWSAAHHLYRLAAGLAPDNYCASLCTGGCLMFLNRPDEAATWFRQAIALNPEEADAHINLGMALLSSGNLQEGWREFEWRCCAINQQLPPIPALPAIPAGSRLDGTTVLIHAEQGLGDLLQFARYLPMLAATGARIIASVPAAMQRLIGSLAGVSRAVSHGELLPEADYQLPLLSLPERLSELVPATPAQVPYLLPDPSLQAAWRSQLADNSTLKVGLIWRGSNLGKSGYSRGLTAEQLRPLTGLEQTTCYSLQLGATTEELSQLTGIIDLAPQITDFADTAAIMANLDLVVSVDTSTAHLAGALGVRCWVPLLFAPDWRWYPLHDQDSRWYPTLTAFRQPIPGRWQPVIAELAAALQGEALLHQGHQLGRTDRRKEAIEKFRAAAELPGRNGPALLNLGIYLRADGELLQAKEALLQATQADPTYPEAWQNLGLAHQGLGELPEAYTCLKRALTLRADYSTARWNLGLLQLLLGEYGPGFENFEARFTKLAAVARLHGNIPAWDGVPSPGKTVLIHAEQGYGDTIQFVRFIPIVAERVGTVILEVQDQALCELCQSVPGVTSIVVRGEMLPTIDCQAPLLSLPRLLEISLETLPHKIPYLTADKQKTGHWDSKLPHDGRRRIGICWKGRPTPDPNRSIPFDELKALFELPGICWISLQTEQEQAAQLPEVMIDLSHEIRDFSDTAAIMSCLDLVISIDSAVAHLAGALGISGIVLLPFAPDWRWGLEDMTAPWYQTLQLVRQKKPREWEQAVLQTCILTRTALLTA